MFLVQILISISIIFVLFFIFIMKIGFRYPFNKFGWDMFLWNIYYVPKYKLQLFFRLRKISYSNFDIVDSINEIIFITYCHWFETCQKRYKELDSCNRDATPGWIPFEKLEHIYKYIKFYRIHNKQILDHLMDVEFESTNNLWEDIVNSDSKRLITIHKYYLDFQVEMNENFNFIKINDIKIINKEKKKKSIHFIMEIEDKINKWDDLIAKSIIDMRQHLWV